MSSELRRLPIIFLWDRVVVPIQGEVTDELADKLSDDVLAAIHRSRARGLVIDLTGVWLVDSHLCAMLSHIASAALLMGAQTVLSGLSPEIAMTLQTMGVEFTNVRTALTLEHALTILGLEVRDLDRDAEDDDDAEWEVSASHPDEPARGAPVDPRSPALTADGGRSHAHQEGTSPWSR
jgi:rsbT antagonist protein RsbS